MKRLLEWTGYVIGGLVVLVGASVGIMSCVSDSRATTRYDISPEPVELPTGPEALAEGERLYIARGCVDCHGEDGAGRVIMDDAPARIAGSNLTKTARAYSNVDLVRAVRHGVAKDGRPLIFMPSHEYWGMSDADLGHILAYVRSLPAMDRDPPVSEVRVLGKVLHVIDALPMYPAEKIDHDAPRPEPLEPAPTAEYGAYLAVGCIGCHGHGYSGGPIPGAPPELGIPANLTPHDSGLAGWTEDQFITVMRTGKRPDGRQIASAQMPWENFRRMTEVELKAIWAFLQTLEPVESGNR